jgi:MFS family permease
MVIFPSALFYTKEEMGLRLGYWFGFAAVAGAFGGLIAFGIQHAHYIAHWRLLFLVEVRSQFEHAVMTPC